jgi:acyl-CoA synthetase (NDP forming)
VNYSTSETISQIEDLFHPRSVAIVGIPRGFKVGKLYLIALQDQEYPGEIYLVNPKADEIDGYKCYPSVASIPGPVDLAIVLVPHHSTLPVVRECAEKGVRGAVLFTAGYKETGTEEGKMLEQELVRVARSSGMRLIGPNGMGLYAPKSGLSFFPQLSREKGSVGIISHSGSLTNLIGRMASQKGLSFSKMVSLGNECDLSSGDFLSYLGQDADTRIIGAYIEGIGDGAYFLRALKTASLAKPVVLWKVGLTPEGSRAASSHTGAMAGSSEIWEGIVQQGGGTAVAGMEAWIDTLMAFSLLPDALGDRVAIISGPGGLAVSAAEACGKEGLGLATLSPETESKLSGFIPKTGTSLKNPIDVGMTASLEMDIYIQAVAHVSADPNVDAVIVIGIGMTPESNQQYTEAVIRIREKHKIPFLIVNVPGFDPEFGHTFCEAGIPFFESAERAMKAYARVLAYQRWRREQKGQDR